MAKKTKENKKKEIIEVMNYRSGEGMINTVYVGSMATAGAMRILGGIYSRDNFDDLLSKATDNQIDECYEYLDSYIQHMLDNPVKKCPHCGQIMSDKQ